MTCTVKSASEMALWAQNNILVQVHCNFHRIICDYLCAAHHATQGTIVDNHESLDWHDDDNVEKRSILHFCGLPDAVAYSL